MIFRGEKPAIDPDDGPILIVDDQADHRVRELMAKQFSLWEFGVFVAQDAGIALALSQEIRPALIVVGEITIEMNVPAFLHELKMKLKPTPPPISILVGTWPYFSFGRESVPIISLSPIISVDELLSVTDDLCAA
jgi:hypothetical protein